MALSNSELRSKLAKAKGLGAAHHGVSHWWLQRLTAVALIPLLPWFMYEFLHAMLTPDAYAVRAWFSHPAHAAIMIVMLVALFYHAKLGAQVVIEDYVHAPVLKYALLLANVFVSFAFAAVSVMAVLRLHFYM